MTEIPGVDAGQNNTPATPQALANRLYAAIAAGDTRAIDGLLHPDVTLSVPGDNPVSGTYHGRPGLLEFTSATAAIAPGGARTQVVDVMGGDRHAAVYGISTATRPGRPALRNPTVHLVAVEQGRIIAVTIYNQEQSRVDAFWS